jgi:rhamnosyltransferase
VAVLLATHNGQCFIREQVDSILDQQGVEIQIHASDDSSTDGTLVLLAALARVDRRLHVLPPGRFGSAADNFLSLLRWLSLDGYDYVAFADQDDVWLPDKLHRAIMHLSAAGADGYSSDLLAFDTATGEEWIVRKSAAARKLDYLFGGASAGCTYVMTARAAAVVRGAIVSNPARGWSHDWLIYAICRSNGLSWVFDRESRIRYRQHSSNAYGARSGLRGAMKRVSQVANGWYCEQILENGKFLAGQAEERKVLDRLARLSALDRVWLALNGWRFRRRRFDGFALSMFAPFMGLSVPR